MVMLVWVLFILGTGPAGNHQVIDNFPSKAACNVFRNNVQQMLDQVGASGSRVSECLSRSVLMPGNVTGRPQP